MKILVLVLRGSKGFNTIELLVGVAILTVVALAGATLAGVADKATNYPDRKQELESFASFLMENLRNEKTCTEALAGNNLSGNNSNGKARGNAFGQNRLTQGQPRFLWIENIRNLQAGPSMTGTSLDSTATNPLERQILPRRLQVNDLSLRDAKFLSSSGGNTTYMANVWLQAEEIGGMSFKPIMIGTISLVANASDDLVSCQSIPSDALAATCASSAGMGCVWDPNSQPNCRCLRSQMLCTAPGYYPVAFRNGVPDCRPLGGGSCTNANEYLVGIELEKTVCAPVPTVCPTGSSTSGAGNPVAGLINCKCNNVGETYYTGVGCQAPVTITCVGGATGAVTASPASPAGCYCPAGETWNAGTSTCEIPSTPVAGVCGPANGQTFGSPPATNLCSRGANTAVTNSGGSGYNWQCLGSGGGANASCNANRGGGGGPTCSGTIVVRPQIFISGSGGGGTPGVDYEPQTDQICRGAGMQPWHERSVVPFVQDKWNPICCDTGSGPSSSGLECGNVGGNCSPINTESADFVYCGGERTVFGTCEADWVKCNEFGKVEMLTGNCQ